MRLPELARELHVPDHDMWLLAAGLMRTGGGWYAVFVAGIELTEPAEQAIREHIDGSYRGHTSAVRAVSRTRRGPVPT